MTEPAEGEVRMSGNARRMGTSIVGVLAVAGGLLVGLGAMATPADAAHYR